MSKISRFHFYPERVVWVGTGILGLTLLIALFPFLLLHTSHPYFFMSKGKREISEKSKPLTFELGLKNKGLILPIPDLQGEISFSFDPPRPLGPSVGKRLLVRMKRSGESKRVVLPCRIDLEFQKDKLVFAQSPSSFWVELTMAPNGLIEGKSFINSFEGETMDAGVFSLAAQDCPVQGANEFAENSPFRLLAETRWWGRDLFREQMEVGERVEIGSGQILELKEGDWLVWKDQKWQLSQVPEADLPIARIQSQTGKALIFEGWDLMGHIRISLTPAPAPPFKIKGEELFSSIRIRSEKQISCMLEKQCMVLKTGDWVLKTGGRWKILRKKDEREAFLHGKLFGELFVFEQISQKQGQKMIQGKLFNPGRTQVVSIELSGQSARKKGRV